MAWRQPLQLWKTPDVDFWNWRKTYMKHVHYQVATQSNNALPCEKKKGPYMAIHEGKPYWWWTRWMNGWKGKNKLPYTLPDNDMNANFSHEPFFQLIYLMNYVKVANFSLCTLLFKLFDFSLIYSKANQKLNKRENMVNRNHFHH